MSVADAIENHLKDMEERRHRREHVSYRLAGVGFIILILGFVAILGFTTHQTTMEKVQRAERLTTRCLDKGWNPVTCRKMSDLSWDNPQSGVKSVVKKK